MDSEVRFNNVSCFPFAFNSVIKIYYITVSLCHHFILVGMDQAAVLFPFLEKLNAILRNKNNLSDHYKHVITVLSSTLVTSLVLSSCSKLQPFVLLEKRIIFVLFIVTGNSDKIEVGIIVS